MSRLVTVPIESNREFAAELGIFLSQWAVVEGNLVWALEVALRTGQVQAQIIFKSNNGLRDKVELITRLLYVMYEDDSILQKLIGLLSSAEKMNSERNTLVHATWLAGGEGNPDSFAATSGRFPKSKKETHRELVMVSLQDLKAGALRLSELNGAFTDFQFGEFARLKLLQQ